MLFPSLVLGCPEAEPGGTGSAATAPREASGTIDEGRAASESDRVRIVIEERGRARIPAAALRETDAVLIELGLSDDAAGGERVVRMVSVDGRRLETVARGRDDAAGRFVVEVAPDFLRPGLYMIEVDARDAHPIDLRRYVLTVEP